MCEKNVGHKNQDEKPRKNNWNPKREHSMKLLSTLEYIHIYREISE